MDATNTNVETARNANIVLAYETFGPPGAPNAFFA